jgi:NADH-quinone oxidoreductase subunit M
MLYLYRRVILGKLDKEDLKSILDLSPREIAIFAPLIVVTIWMGVWPAPFLDVMDASIANLIEQHKVAMNTLQSVSLTGK